MKELLERIYRDYRSNNRIYAAMLELTWRCVANCVHCYLLDENPPELDTAQVLDLLEQLREEGTIDLGLTGGEVMIRKDFPVILEAAHKAGFKISVLTTGILIDERMADLLRDCRVHHVEMSILGGNAETHDRLMRHPGAFDKMIRGMRMLRDRKIPGVMKATVLRENAGELEAMRGVADSLKVMFSANATLLPTVDGGSKPQELGLDSAAAASLDPKLLTGGFIEDGELSGGAVLTCNAGKINCCVSPDGSVYPCLIWRRPVGSVLENRIYDIWHAKPDPYLVKIREATPQDSGICHACPKKDSCKRCPGSAFSETGDFQAPIPSACRLSGLGGH